LSSNSAELLAESGGAQSEAKKRKFEGASAHHLKKEIQTSFDERTKQLVNLDPKIPDGSEIYVAWL
jgi:hypothetical protein